MIYTGAPQNSIRVAVNKLQVAEFQRLLAVANITPAHVIVHAPYIINLANAYKPSVFEWSVHFLRTEIARTAAIGGSIIVLHPGSYGLTDAQTGLEQLVRGLNQILTPQLKVRIALETMSGKGTQVGITFDQLKYIIDHVKCSELVGVCWDTCHLFDASYDVKDHLATVLAEFKHKIGLDKLWVIHLNDSKAPLGGRSDRHANLGYGYIGFPALLRIAHHPEFQHIPKILETPFVNNVSPYQAEIKMIRQQQFNDPFPHLKFTP